MKSEIRRHSKADFYMGELGRVLRKCSLQAPLTMNAQTRNKCRNQSETVLIMHNYSAEVDGQMRRESGRL